MTAARNRPVTSAEDLAEAKRRAKTARTPIAKAATKQVVERKQRAYNGTAAKEVRATARGTRSSAARVPQNTRTGRSKK